MRAASGSAPRDADAGFFEDFAAQRRRHVLVGLDAARRQTEATGGIVALDVQQDAARGGAAIQDVADFADAPVPQQGLVAGRQERIGDRQVPVLRDRVRPRGAQAVEVRVRLRAGHAGYLVNCGSMASRKPSPSRYSESTVRKIRIPGGKMRCQAT